jgi:rhamnosyltransferase
VSITTLIVYDNSPEPLDSRCFKESTRGLSQILYEHHPSNIGISGALARAWNKAIEDNYTHVWFFDQDSIPSPEAAQALLSTIQSDTEIGLACCLPRVAPDGFALHGLEFDRFRFVRRRSSDDNKAYDCDATITSGTLASVSALKNVRILQEDLFIDSVDHDMCLRVRHAGKRVVVVPEASMRHALGDTQIVTTHFPKRVLRLPNYSPQRLYYICRNHTWVELRASQNLWRFVCVVWRVKFLLWQSWVILHEKGSRTRKIAACFQGTLDGIRGRLGKIMNPPLS